MLDYDSIVQMAKKDIELDDSKLDFESARNPTLQEKYLNFYTDCSLMVNKCEMEYNVLRKKRWEYYSGKCADEVYQEFPLPVKVLKGDINMYLDADQEIIDLKLKVQYYTKLQNYLDKILKIISNRQWDIRNIIEYRKFLSGIV